ncbi:hypothetical protein [Streptomyces lushanensis]|uniref:hypothetical protein n=1 Tax=Streptomyces lushanensis TaxID=1434255 RepID=UPI0008303970|nr:hypothetical protein [Streptomyces lushanensis]
MADLSAAEGDRPPFGAARPDVVPYISCWSSEHRPPGLVVTRGAGIAYDDEGPYERDDLGVLWKRIGYSPGKGRPEFGKVHFLRQRRAMRKLLCQICGGPSDRGPEGTLWLVGEDAEDPELRKPGYVTTHPPLCVPCAVTSVGVCPHLRTRYLALRVRTFALTGVHGALYRPDGLFPVAYSAEGASFGSRRLSWVLATQLVMEFGEFTVVDLDAEHAAHRKRTEARHRIFGEGPTRAPR